MYEYKRAVGIRKALPRGIEFLNISNNLTNELSSLYEELTIVVLDKIADREVSIKAVDYLNDFNSFTGAIQDWLDTKQNIQLKTSLDIPSDSYAFVTLSDIEYRGFHLLPGDSRLSDGAQVKLTKYGAKDIRVKGPDGHSFNYNRLFDNCLWVANGHLTRAVLGPDSIYLLGAGRNHLVYDDTHVCVLNFAGVSKVKTYPINEGDFKVVRGSKSTRIYYNSPVALKDKTVWMSIGGRLYLNDVLVNKGDDSLLIKAENIDWFTKTFDSKNFIDLNGILDKERSVVDEDFFLTEEFFTKLLTHENSFLIVLENPKVYVSTKPVYKYSHPFTYHTEERRAIPIIVGGGLIPKYFTRAIINRRLLDISLGIQRKYVNKTSGSNNEGGVLHNFTNRHTPSYLHNAHLLYIRGIQSEV